MNQSISIIVVFFALIGLSLAYGNEFSSSSSNLVSSILVAIGFGMIAKLTQTLAPKFVFSLLPYHSVSC
eukprot:gene10672-13072_t